jgi:hypothetical protein
MSSAYGPDGPTDHISKDAPEILRPSIECQLFESLVHHLIEKGVMTTNDALSVVQTVAEVERGALEETRIEPASADDGLAILKRLYSSFALIDPPFASKAYDSENVLQLRPPLHGDRPEFPQDD